MSTSIQDVLRMAVHVAADDPDPPPPKTVTVEGWVRTSRFAKRVTFLHLYDGSTDRTIQVVLSPAVEPSMRSQLGVGTAVRVTGELVPSKGAEQDSEIKTEPDRVEVVGPCDASEYPVQKKEATAEFWRTIPHLRVRAAEHMRTFRARSFLSQVVHSFFHGKGFHWVHTPIVTFSDCEGAGEMFHVTTEGEGEFFGRPASLTVSGQLEVETFCMALGKVYTFGPTFRAENSHTSRHASEFWMIEPEIAFASLDDVMDLAEQFVTTLLRKMVLEGFACEERVAEETSYRAEAGRKFLATLRSWDEGEEPVPEYKDIIKPKRFARCTYTEAMTILAESGRSFEHPIGWGESLQAEHERYLAEEHFGGPVFVTHYPIEQKPFYMRVTDCALCGGLGYLPGLLMDPEGNTPTWTREQAKEAEAAGLRGIPWCSSCDGTGTPTERQTVECFDLLVPGVGEIIGGSAREERLDRLVAQMERCEIDMAEYDWYLDLRRYGSVPHGGFGLGFERALMWLLGVSNIRDVLPFPRTPA